MREGNLYDPAHTKLSCIMMTIQEIACKNYLQAANKKEKGHKHTDPAQCKVSEMTKVSTRLQLSEISETGQVFDS